MNTLSPKRLKILNSNTSYPAIGTRNTSFFLSSPGVNTLAKVMNWFTDTLLQMVSLQPVALVASKQIQKVSVPV